MKYHIYLLVFTLYVAGCTPVVQEAKNEDAISSITMTCNKPYRLTQDCSVWNGAQKKMSIDGFMVKMAASEDGKIILVMDAHMIKNSLLDSYFSPITGSIHSEASNNSFEAVKRFLYEKDVAILKVRPILTLANIDGYILELDQDGYSLIKMEYSKGTELSDGDKVCEGKWQDEDPCAPCYYGFSRCEDKIEGTE